MNSSDEKTKNNGSYSFLDVILAALFTAFLAYLAISDNIPIFDIGMPPPVVLSLPTLFLIIHMINRR